MATRRRNAADSQPIRSVKCTVVIDVDTHAKLAALAALRGCDRSTIAADAIRAAVASVVVFDRAVGKRKPSDQPDLSGEVDRTEEAA